MMVTVKFSDLSAAFAFVSFAAPMEHRAYISVDNGAIYWGSELNPIDETSGTHLRRNPPSVP